MAPESTPNRQTDEQLAKQSRLCMHCDQQVFAPLLDSDSVAGGAVRRRSRRFGRGWSVAALLAIGISVLLVCGGFVAYQFIQDWQHARWVLCSHNLKQIGLALHHYHSKYGCFPPAYVPDKDGKPMHSWRVLLLPFLGEEELYTQYRFDEPWDGPHNRALAAEMPPLYCCASARARHGTQTSYVMLVGPHAISNGPTGRTFKDIKNATSDTIVVVEVGNASVHWMEPRDIDAESVRIRRQSENSPDPGTARSEIASNHPRGVNALFADGSVRFLSETVNLAAFRAMTMIDGPKAAAPTD
jgi:prepilin-type processing-associated H-X9-DG protein